MTPASAYGDCRFMTGRAMTRRIAALDPVIDHEEITHLSTGVRYGDPLFVHAAYTIAFARQVAIPSISRIVYRAGTGDMMRNVRQRNSDTLLFFGEMLRNGHSSAHGRAVIDRMEQIHARFGITDDDKLYTLGSLAFEADRILASLDLDVFTGAERLARYLFWRGVGERMGLDVPATRAEFFAWTLDYERRHYASTEGGQALVAQLLVDWEQRWFPPRLRRFAAPVMLALLDEPLRAVHRLPDPPKYVSANISRVVRPYLAVAAARPHNPNRSWSDYFGAAHRRPLNVETLGHRAPSTHEQAESV
ncbi:oxygenase MpaB family protein [Nocardia callitridis]|uniref:ER-bound oxygenase mpaB/mpaB'/Rubber oxygenase catalytic domain-containing protein n=1 Tax=Nocardia callitridis TaxID=648753 RepID=A0ABP9KUJ2_9NOCA